MNVIDCLKATLDEDIRDGDITSQLLLTEEAQASANIIAKNKGIFCGLDIIAGLRTLYPSLTFNMNVSDGDCLEKGTICLTIDGNIQDIVIVERTLLNFLQRLSGISTITRQFVDTLNDESIKVLDTRKTTPLLRMLEKKAVVAGGGFNHRFGLYDMVLVKENHLISYIKEFGIDAFNKKIEQHKCLSPSILVEVEVNDFSLLNQLNLNLIDIIMLDNMNMNELLDSIRIINQQSNPPLKEVSGNITLDTIGQYNGVDIDRISVGSLTHSVKALDLSLIVK